MSIEVKDDAFNLLCGRLIGSGMTRKVFNCNLRPDVVIKVEDADIRTHFQNLQEWFVWNRISGTNLEKWFAPVIEISPNGRLLIMARTEPVGASSLPTKMPAFFTDFKPENYGLYKGHIVCHDYGSNLLMERGMTKAMRTVKWNQS